MPWSIRPCVSTKVGDQNVHVAFPSFWAAAKMSPKRAWRCLCASSSDVAVCVAVFIICWRLCLWVSEKKGTFAIGRSPRPRP